MLYEVITRTHVGEQRQLTGPLYGLGQFALMLGTGAIDTTRNNFATLSDKITKSFRILVINGHFFVGTKTTNSTAGKNLRITSYNVCYTKLLRRVAGDGPQFLTEMRHHGEEQGQNGLHCFFLHGCVNA